MKLYVCVPVLYRELFLNIYNDWIYVRFCTESDVKLFTCILFFKC